MARRSHRAGTTVQAARTRAIGDRLNPELRSGYIDETDPRYAALRRMERAQVSNGPRKPHCARMGQESDRSQTYGMGTLIITGN
jgi:hypothetical protein